MDEHLQLFGGSERVNLHGRDLNRGCRRVLKDLQYRIVCRSTGTLNGLEAAILLAPSLLSGER